MSVLTISIFQESTATFALFDRDNSGTIDFDEFLSNLRVRFGLDVHSWYCSGTLNVIQSWSVYQTPLGGTGHV